NRSEGPKSYSISRREHHPNGIESIHAGSRQLSWDSRGDDIEFKLELMPGETSLMTLRFKAAEESAYGHQNFVHSTKTMLRRYLSEARDNYVAPAKARLAAFSRS